MYYNRYRVEKTMDYPHAIVGIGKTKEVTIPNPRELEFVREVVRKQYRLGRREFAEDVSAIIGK
jgi:hypothetical protein